MNFHKKARMTPIGRERLVVGVLSGQTPQEVSVGEQADQSGPQQHRQPLDPERLHGDNRVGQ